MSDKGCSTHLWVDVSGEQPCPYCLAVVAEAENEQLRAIALDVKRAACEENGPVNFQTAIDNLIAYLEEKP